MGAVKNAFHDEISGYCPTCGSSCACGDIEYAEDVRQSVDRQADGQPVSDMARSAYAQLLETAARDKPWEGEGLTFGPAPNSPSEESASEAHTPERVVLDVATLRYVIGCLELQARHCSTSRHSPVAAKLRSMASNWRALIEDCATVEAIDG